MAELSVGTLQMTITADGSAAISEIERVQGAAQSAAQSMEGLSGDSLGEVGRSAGEAASGLSEAGSAAAGAAGGLGQTEQAAGRAGRSMKELGESLSKVGSSMTKFVTLPIAGLMTAGVKGASDLAETVGKTEVVFGALSERVMAWSEQSVQAMGLARGTALEFASTYGDMATGMGLTIDQATQMSMSLTQLAADMASFKNISTDLAAQKLNAVFTGETEGLKSMGIVMTQANLQAFALSQGITEQVSKLSQAEQVMLRYRYVMEATKNAQGDFARTGDSLANQSRKLGETVKQLGESFGAQLVPMVTPVVAKLQEMAQAFSELDTGTKNTIIAIAGVAAAVGPILLVGGKILTLIASVQGALAALSINPVMLALAGIAAAVAGVVALKNALDNASGEAKSTGDAFDRMRGAIDRPFEADVSVSVEGTEQLDALDGIEDKSAKVTLVTDGEKALADAQAAVDALEGEHFGTVEIDGTTTDIDGAIDSIQADLNALDSQVIITADGSAILNEGADGTIAQIQAKISALQATIPLVADETKRALLESQLTALQDKLTALSAGVSLDVALGEGATANAQAFADAVAQLPEDKTYKATGEFVMPESTQETVDQYVAALGQAASATGNYKDAVDALNKVADSDAQEKITQVQSQGAEAAQGLARQLNDGIITQEQYDAGIRTIVDDMTEQVEAIESARDAQKEANKIFADGSRENDYAAFGEGIKQTVKGQGVTKEDTSVAMQRLNSEKAGGGDMSEVATEGQVALQGALAATREQYATLSAAVEQYNADMAGAQATQDAADAEYTARTERINQMGEAMNRYNEITGMGLSGEEAMGILEGEMDPAIVEDFTEAVTNADGSLLTYAQSFDALEGVEAEAAEAEQKHADAMAAADAQRQSAREGLQAQVDAAMQAQGVLGDTSALEGMLDTVEQTGTEVTEAQRNAIVGVQQLAQDMNQALAGEDPTAALSGMVTQLEGLGAQVEAAGQGVAQGFANGMGDTGAASAAGQELGQAGVDGVNSGAGTHSPSAITTQTGRDVAQGLANGMGDTGAVSSAGAALGAAAVGAVQSAASAAAAAGSGAGGQIGRNLISGATAGVRSAAAALAQAAAQAVRNAVNAAKAAAEIHSPSRLMEREVGVQLPRGAVVGVEKETEKLLPRMRAATMKLVSGASGAARNAALPVPAAEGPGVDYRAMGDAMKDAMGEVRFGFSVGDRELAQATRTANSREQAVRARQINTGYGGR